MAEGAITQLKEVPHEIRKFPVMAIGIGIAFLFLVLLIEAFKPGLITGPIRSVLHAIGFKTA
jgi:hypothetical protein